MMRVPGTAMAGLAALAFVCPAWGATYYVTPSGNGGATGADWANAYSAAQLQTAVGACSTAGDEIYLRHGVYSNSAQISAVSRPGLTIRGGYEGVGSPGGFTNDPTVLTRVLSVTNRIFYGEASTLTLDRLTITNGLLVEISNDVAGGGLFLTNCNTLVTNCLIEANRLPIPYRNPAITKAHKGSGIYAITGTLVVVSSRFRDNGHAIYSFNYCGSRFGDGICAYNASVTLAHVTFEHHTIGGRDGMYGGCVFLFGGNASIVDCDFNTNTINNGWTCHGGAVYAENVRPLAISNCAFRSNTMSGASLSYAYGGALWIKASYPFSISGCVFEGQSLRSVSGLPRGNVMYLEGAGLAGTISDCSMVGGINGTALEMVYADVASPNRIAFRNTTIRGRTEGGGLFKTGTGSLAMTNCLVAATVGHGLQVTNSGPVNLAHCTLADHMGWGVTNASAPLTITDSIVWGNYVGGVGSTNGGASYTCSQETLAGAGNLNTNPLWITGYYLSTNSLPYQPSNSPCIDAGSMTAAAAGLDERTTRTDGAKDEGPVDLGYHAPTGTVVAISNLVLYVDVATGSDANNGWSAGAGGALKTLTAALAKAIDGTTVHVASGLYNWASGETFPLTSRTPNLSVKGAARDTTILDATLTNRVFTAEGRGRVWFEGLTLTNGNAMYGAGLYLPSCLSATVTNCAVMGNGMTNYSYTYGCGIYAINGALDVLDSVVRGNRIKVQGETSYGGGIYALNAAVTLRSLLVDFNYLKVNSGAYGPGVYLSGGSAMISGCAFGTNFANVGYNHQGGAICASAVNTLTISNCTFVGNYLSSFNGTAQGGALYITGCKPLTVARCTFTGNSVASINAAPEGGTMLLTGAALAGTISDCDIVGQSSGATPEVLSISTTTTNSLTILNTAMKSVVGMGINKKGTGSLALTNCLLHTFATHAVQAGAGTVTVANSTLADNGGWGVTNNLAVLNVIDSILWGNLAGGVRSTSGSVSYTCSQEPLAGTGNMTTNPLWIAGYYLSSNGLPYQNLSSPCIDAGSMTAVAAGLDTRCTRTDGSNDLGVVDLGYHQTNGTGTALSNMVLYVDVVAGGDGNDGWNAGEPLKTLTAALARTIDGSTIHVATGRYCQASGETFPLASRAPNLTLIGTSRDTTILDATLTNRVFTGDGRGRIWLEGLTFANGSLTDAWRYGGGLYLPGCQTVVTNCVIVSNRIDLTGNAYGQGIAAVQGTLTVVDSVVRGNGKPTSSGADDLGGGIYAYNAAVELRRVTVNANVLKVNANAQGAGAYLAGGRALIDDCSFTTNRADSGYGHRGGAIYATGVNPLTIRDSDFVGNYGWSFNGVANGGALWIGTSPALVTNCTFVGNFVGAQNSSSKGGALKFQNCSGFTITACVFTNNSTRYINNVTMEGGVIYMTGTPLSGTIAGCTIYGQTNSPAALENLSFSPGVSNTVAMVNTALRRGNGTGVLKFGLGALELTNCLVHSFTNHGVRVTAGSVVLVNSTLANNGGWGMSNATSVVTARNCIAWGNTNGGFAGSGNTISYTCSQEAQTGEGNLDMNPLFAGAATNNFQLLRSSPCINAGANEAWMVAATDLDGNKRIRSGRVDMGAYEAKAGFGAVFVIR